MNCPNCGSPIKEGEIMCSTCRMPVALMSGTPVSPSPIVPTTVEPTYDTKGTIPSMPYQESAPIQTENVQEDLASNQYKNYGEGKKAVTSLKFLVPILFGMILLVFVVFGIYMVIKTYIQDKKIDPKEEVISTYQIEFGEYMYTLSGDLTYSKDSSSHLFHIAPSDNTWSSSLQVIPTTYASARGQKAALKSYFQSTGYTVSEVEEQVYGDSSFLLLKATKGRKKYLLAVTKAGESPNCFGIVIERQDNEYGYDVLETLAKITTNVKYEKQTTSGKGQVDFDFTNALK